MKRLGYLFLILAFTLTTFAGTAAFSAEEPLPPAAAAFDCARLEKYATYQYDPSSGDWRVCANEVVSALELLADQAGRFTDGVSYFYLEITGNAFTGLITPVLNVYYIGRLANNAAAVSFRIETRRYDFPVTVESVSVNGRAASLMRAPMDGDGLNMLRRMDASQSVYMRIHGDEAYSCLAKPASSYKSAREQVEALSLASLPPMLRELNELGIDRYQLWDLNDTRWTHLTGVAPRMELASIEAAATQRGIELDANFNMLSPGAKGKSVAALQERLAALHYLTGKADGTYGSSTRTAIRNIQKLIGDIPTGSVDRALLNRLFAGTIEPGAGEAAPAEPDWKALSGDALLTLDRYWFASSVTASRGDISLARRSASNQDNVLIVFDGKVKNRGLQPLDLTWRLSGTIAYDGQYEFPCTLVCERDEGLGFGDSLIPLAQSRLVIYAEIPRGLPESGGVWVLTLKAGDGELTYPLG